MKSKGICVRFRGFRRTLLIPFVVAVFAAQTAAASPGDIATYAGGGIGDGGPASSARVSASSGVAVDSAGNLFIADSFNNRIRKVDTSGTITTVAGNGTQGYSGDGGPATSASLNNPRGIAVDSAGNLFIADTGNNRIRSVDTAGAITTVAGGGNPVILGSVVYVGDGGPAVSANLLAPRGVAVDTTGNLFIADTANSRIREVNALGIITTVAGNGTYGYSGDGGLALLAQISSPQGIAIDSAGNVFIADTGNNRVRKVNTSGTITSVAGNGTYGYSTGDGGLATSARLASPSGVAVDSTGNLFIALPPGNRIRKVNTLGTITTVAGNGDWSMGGPQDGGPATSATVRAPEGVAVDSTGNLFIADTGYQRIRKVDASGTITSVVGGAIGDGGPATSAYLSASHIAADSAGNLFIADSYNNRIRKVDTAGNITTVAGTGSFYYSGDGGPATSASFRGFGGIAVDGTGNIFIADVINRRIRKVSTSGTITTIAGNGTDVGGGVYYYPHDGVLATSTAIGYPTGLAVDSVGNVFIADGGNFVVRKVDTSGVITTVAGNHPSDYSAFSGQGYSGDGGPATSANLHNPRGLAVDAAGDLFIADANNFVVRKVSASGIITTVAGNGTHGYSGDGGPATSASFGYLNFDVTVDSTGNLYIADPDNNRIRKVDTSGTISTVAGNGTAGYEGDGGPATSASLYSPGGVAVDSAGNLFIADTTNNCIRKVAG